jgi:hypothetical protein
MLPGTGAGSAMAPAHALNRRIRCRPQLRFAAYGLDA